MYANFQARVGLVQLRKLDELLAKRCDLVELYNRELDAVAGIDLPPLIDGAAYSFYTLRVPRRDEIDFKQRMIRHGVAVDQSYDYALPDLGPYRSFAGGRYPCAVQAAREVINLPFYPHLREIQVRHISACVRDCAQEVSID
jgi:aminotransferase